MSYTTIEKLQSAYSATASIIPYKDWIIVAFPTYRGVEARLFESVDIGEDIPPYEARYLEIYEEEDQVFEDQGRAVRWAFDRIDNIANENMK